MAYPQREEMDWVTPHWWDSAILKRTHNDSVSFGRVALEYMYTYFCLQVGYAQDCIVTVTDIRLITLDLY